MRLHDVIDGGQTYITGARFLGPGDDPSSGVRVSGRVHADVQDVAALANSQRIHSLHLARIMIEYPPNIREASSFGRMRRGILVKRVAGRCGLSSATGVKNQSTTL